jgi:hypothetical protein
VFVNNNRIALNRSSAEVNRGREVGEVAPAHFNGRSRHTPMGRKCRSLRALTPGSCCEAT